MAVKQAELGGIIQLCVWQSLESHSQILPSPHTPFIYLTEIIYLIC